MKTRSLLLIIITTLFCLPHRSVAQLAACTSEVPFFSVDLAGYPSGSWTSPSHSRDGQCYDATDPDLCTSFRVLVDTGAAMIKLEIVSGALPTGAMYYQVNGGPEIPVATPISISGTGPFDITFCKPGNNKNTYRISTMSHATASIAGITAVSVCSQTTLSCGVAGGTWSSSNTSVATVNSSGVVTGVTPGTASIVYIINSSTVDVATVTVDPMPAITGNDFVCGSGTTVLANATSGGTWSSNNTEVATVNSSGVVSGVANGTATISYNVGVTCSTTKVVSVNPSVTAIAGTLSVCSGSVTTLTTATPGGTWSSSSGGIATIDTLGIATGVAAGTVNITYQISGGCRDIKVLSVNASPAPITGTASMCAGDTIILANTTVGGIWSTANTGIATVNASGVVSSVAAGSTSISYSTSAGCTTTTQVTVNARPSTISGSSSVCFGSTATFSAGCTGGNWACSDTTVGTMDCTGVFHPGSCGATTIAYVSAVGCSVSKTLTVNPIASIMGRNQVCKNLTTTLGCAVTGGHWDTNPHSVADITDATGILQGKDTGTVTISYTTAAGCIVTRQATVNQYVYPLETSPLTSPMQKNICVGTNLQLNSPYGGGGIWSTSDTTVATVTNTIPGSSVQWGLVTGRSVGPVTISYTASNGCVSTHAVTINPMPSISGAPTICRYATTTLAGTPTGGQWFSHNAAVASVGINTGVVMGASAGTVSIFYRLYNFDACSASTIETVNVCTGSKEESGARQLAGAVPDAFDVYPNPGNGLFTIRHGGLDDGSARVIVVNYMGQIVYEGSVVFSGGRGHLDLTNVQPGIYLVQLQGKPGEKNVLRVSVQ